MLGIEDSVQNQKMSFFDSFDKNKIFLPPCVKIFYFLQENFKLEIFFL